VINPDGSYICELDDAGGGGNVSLIAVFSGYRSVSANAYFPTSIQAKCPIGWKIHTGGYMVYGGYPWPKLNVTRNYPRPIGNYSTGKEWEPHWGTGDEWNVVVSRPETVFFADQASSVQAVAYCVR